MKEDKFGVRTVVALVAFFILVILLGSYVGKKLVNVVRASGDAEVGAAPLKSQESQVPAAAVTLEYVGTADETAPEIGEPLVLQTEAAAEMPETSQTPEVEPEAAAYPVDEPEPLLPIAVEEEIPLSEASAAQETAPEPEEEAAAEKLPEQSLSITIPEEDALEEIMPETAAQDELLPEPAAAEESEPQNEEATALTEKPRPSLWARILAFFNFGKRKQASDPLAEAAEVTGTESVPEPASIEPLVQAPEEADQVLAEELPQELPPAPEEQAERPLTEEFDFSDYACLAPEYEETMPEIDAEIQSAEPNWMAEDAELLDEGEAYESGGGVLSSEGDPQEIEEKQVEAAAQPQQATAQPTAQPTQEPATPAPTATPGAMPVVGASGNPDEIGRTGILFALAGSLALGFFFWKLASSKLKQ